MRARDLMMPLAVFLLLSQIVDAGAQTAPRRTDRAPEALLEVGRWHRWSELPPRRWLGEHLWGNRLQDWQVRDGALVYTAQPSSSMRNVHLLSRRLGHDNAAFVMQTEVEFAHVPATQARDGMVGFHFGAGQDYLGDVAAAMVQGMPGLGGGMLAAVDIAAGGRAHFRDMETQTHVALAPVIDAEQRTTGSVTAQRSGRRLLRLEATPDGPATCRLEFSSLTADGTLIERVMLPGVPADRLVGNVALVAGGGPVGCEVRFHDWLIGGERFVESGTRFGPFAGVLYSRVGSRVRIGVQLVPLGVLGVPVDDFTIKLELREDRSRWGSAATSALVSGPDYHTVLDLDSLESDRATEARVRLVDLDGVEYVYPFSIRPEPTGRLTLAALACMGQIVGWAHRPTPETGPDQVPIGRWTQAGVLWPFASDVDAIIGQDPDIVFFTGDQIYEGTPTGVAAGGAPYEDYLYKFLLWHWAFQPVTRTRPSILQTDDHDVYHPDLFGQDRMGNAGRDQDGGFHRDAAFVECVQKTMTGHMPDPLEGPSLNTGLSNYYTSFDYGGVGFFVLEDRKFKRGPRTEDPDYPETFLGDRQLGHLRRWARTHGNHQVKCAVAQTIYAGMSLTFQGTFAWDCDPNAIYVDERDEIVRMLGDAGALLVCGDQHLATFARLGVPASRDADYRPLPEEYMNGCYQLATPAMGNVFWRWFWPAEGVRELGPADPAAPSYVGGFRDFFGNPYTMLAVANPQDPELLNRHLRIRLTVDRDEATRGNAHIRRTCHGEGFSIVRFDHARRDASIEIWSSRESRYGGKLFAGFPITLTYDALRTPGLPAELELE